MLVVALVERHPVVVIDNIRPVFEPIDKVGFDLYVAVWEIEDYAAVAHVVGQSLGAANGIIAVDLYDILVDVGVEHYGAWCAERA